MYCLLVILFLSPTASRIFDQTQQDLLGANIVNNDLSWRILSAQLQRVSLWADGLYSYRLKFWPFYGSEKELRKW